MTGGFHWGLPRVYEGLGVSMVFVWLLTGFAALACFCCGFWFGVEELGHGRFRVSGVVGLAIKRMQATALNTSKSYQE